MELIIKVKPVGGWEHYVDGELTDFRAIPAALRRASRELEFRLRTGEKVPAGHYPFYSEDDGDRQ
jgi:hypothetical protein